jgi:immune inhibitor A
MFVAVPPIRRLTCRRARCQVPPAPELLLQLYARYKALIENKQLPADLPFEHFFAVWCSSRRSENFVGLDDGATAHAADGPQLIDRPPKMLKGVIRTVVLLVDFEDRPHAPTRTPQYFEQMLFGDLDVFPTGSMAEYYRRISNYDRAKRKGIDVQGAVFGWVRLPRPSSFYTAGTSGMGQFPTNAQGLARDAVQAALANGFKFHKADDVLKEKLVTALFVVHAGSGAEQTGSNDDIWSLKWTVPDGGAATNVAGLKVQTFLTVPEDCTMGVCAHEWGHLAARWADFYDTGRVKHLRSNGLGNYCLMASGSWNNGGITPGLPNGMLRMFHDWIKPEVLDGATPTPRTFDLEPAAEKGGGVVIRSPRMTDAQYIFVEYRRRRKQDHFLPDEGVAIYVVDEGIENVNNESALAIELLQADNKRELARTFGQGNQGDSRDLYPDRQGTKVNRAAGKATRPPLNMPSLTVPDGVWSGVTIEVKGNPGDDKMTIEVKVEA